VKHLGYLRGMEWVYYPYMSGIELVQGTVFDSAAKSVIKSVMQGYTLVAKKGIP